MAKGEIAHNEQFHLWPQCFQNSSAAIASKCVSRWERVKLFVMGTEKNSFRDINSLSTDNIRFNLFLPADAFGIGSI